MRRKRFTEEQIIGVLQEATAGMPVRELCRKHGIAETTFHRWRGKFAGMQVNDAKRLKALEDENRRLKKLVAEQALDIAMLKDVAGRKW
jgi:putative transposase